MMKKVLIGILIALGTLAVFFLGYIMVDSENGLTITLVAKSDNTKVVSETEESKKETQEILSTDESTVENTVGVGSVKTSEETEVVKVKTSESTKKNSEKMTEAEIIKRFNDAVNSVKAEKAGYEGWYEVVYGENNTELLLKRVAGKSSSSAEYGEDTTDKFPVEGYDWASTLTADDVESATIVKNGDVYEIEILLGEEKNPKQEGSSYGKCVLIRNTDTLAAFLGTQRNAESSENTYVLYHDGKLTAKIDAKTGRLIEYNMDIVADLKFETLFGTLYANDFGGKGTYTNFKWE